MGFGSSAQGQKETYSHRLYNSCQSKQMDEWLEVLAQLEHDYGIAPSNEILFDIV